MKGINNIRCVSQASTAITHSSSSSLELKPSSSSSSASLPSSSPSSWARPATAPRFLDGSGGGGGGRGGRTIDRYNPIVTDGKRSMAGSITSTTLSSPHPSISDTISPPRKPLPAQNHHNGPAAETKRPNKKKKKSSSTSTTATGRAKRFVDFAKDTNSSSTVLTPHQHYRHQCDQILQLVKKSVSRPTDLRTVKGGGLGRYCTIAKPGVDYISPPESTRYLLDDDTRHGADYDDDNNVDYLNGLSRFDPVLKLDSPFKVKKTVGSDQEVAMATSCDTSEPSANSNNTTTRAPSKLPPQRPQLPSSSTPSSSTGSSSDHQVVVLKVSLHCRGCEGKVRKHISRMQGVTSFSIDFVAKKVTVVGDVTPSGVLASISKVKNAQLWTPQSTSSSPATSASMGG